MEFIILTGMSGAGKSTALKMLEDIGFLCVDNMPIGLVEKFADLAYSGSGERKKTALGIDVRSGEHLDELQDVLDRMEAKGEHYKILFLDADDHTLVKRYKESRRKHPLAGQDPLLVGIGRERDRMQFLKNEADYIIDTSRLLTRDLRAQLKKIFLEGEDFKSLNVSIVSFGFKYGLPEDADLVFDVRFLPNPFYVEELKPLSGKDAPVRHYVMDSPDTAIFIGKIVDLLQFLMPRYVAEGKNDLVVCVGCTGGRHRSVAVAEELYKQLRETGMYAFRLDHRDLEKEK